MADTTTNICLSASGSLEPWTLSRALGGGICPQAQLRGFRGFRQGQHRHLISPSLLSSLSPSKHESLLRDPSNVTGCKGSTSRWEMNQQSTPSTLVK